MGRNSHAKTYWLCAPVALTLATTGACGKKKNDGNTSAPDTQTSSTGPSAGSSAAVSLNFLAAGSAKSTAALNLTVPTTHTGEASAGELLSLKYFITSITICQDAVLSGSGFSSQSGCIDLYSNQGASASLYDTMDQAEAAKPIYDADFKDLIQGLTVTGQISAANVGTYKYAFVNWMKPIKVTAQMTLDDDAGTTLYTHAGTYNNTTDKNGFVHYQTLVPGMTTGPASEAITMLSNGGSVFAFGKPFTITAADLSANTQYSIDMVFNPEGMVKGADSSTALASIFAADGTGTAVDSVAVPYLSIIPLVHKASDAIVKETYLIHFAAGMAGTAVDVGAPITPTTDPFDIRLELYYLQTASTIASGTAVTSDLSEDLYGAHAEMLYVNSGATKTLDPPMGVPNIFSFAKDSSTNTFSFYTWQGTTAPAFIAGFKRLAAPGDSGTATVVCGTSGVMMTAGGCYDASANKYYVVGFNPTYELVGRQDVVSLVKSTLKTIVPYSVGITYDANAVSLTANSCMAFTVAPIKPASKTGVAASDEVAVPAPVDINVGLSANGAVVYTDSACTTTGGTAKITAGGSSASFYVKATAAGQVTVNATAADAVANDSINVTVN